MASTPKSRRASSPERSRNLLRDGRLYLRTISYLRRYKVLAVCTLVTMALEAVLGVVSIAMIQPFLTLIFDQQDIRFEHYAKKYHPTFEPAVAPDGSPMLVVGGYIFLPPHPGAVMDAAVKARTAATPAVGESAFFEERHAGGDSDREPFLLRIEPLIERNDLLLQDLRGRALEAGFRVEGIPQDPHANVRQKTQGIEDRVKVWGLSIVSHALDSVQRRALDDDAFRFRLLVWVMVGLLVLTLLKVIVAFFANFWGKWLGFAVIRDMRAEIYERSLALDFAAFAARTVGDMISRITADLSALQTVVTMVFSRFLQAPMKVLAYLSGLLYISPPLTAISLLAILPICASLLYISNKVRKASRRIQRHRADMTDILQETFSGIRTVQAYAMEPYEMARFVKRNERLNTEQNKSNAYEEISSQLNELILVGVLGGLALLGGWYIILADDYHITGATFITFMLMLAAMWGPVRQWAKSFVKIQQGLAGAERAFEIIDARPAVADLPGAVEYDGANPSIEFRGVSFNYEPGIAVLGGIDLVIPAGRVFALAGRTGGGKSTLASLVPRFYDPTGGAVLVGGRDVREWTLKSLRGHIGFVSQHVVLFDDTVRANIAYGRPDVPLERVIEVARAANMHDEIMAMPAGYDTEVGGQGIKLSGGQRQRIAVARALLKDAPILILDEATSSLDVATEALVQEALDRLMKGRTVIVIAHRLTTIRHADEICLLSGGRIVERGPHDELMKRDGPYAKFQAIQAAMPTTPEA